MGVAWHCCHRLRCITPLCYQRSNFVCRWTWRPHLRPLQGMRLAVWPGTTSQTCPAPRNQPIRSACMQGPETCSAPSTICSTARLGSSLEATQALICHSKQDIILSGTTTHPGRTSLTQGLPKGFPQGVQPGCKGCKSQAAIKRSCLCSGLPDRRWHPSQVLPGVALHEAAEPLDQEQTAPDGARWPPSGKRCNKGHLVLHLPQALLSP